jgi:hypothetical protein
VIQFRICARSTPALICSNEKSCVITFASREASRAAIRFRRFWRAKSSNSSSLKKPISFVVSQWHRLAYPKRNIKLASDLMSLMNVRNVGCNRSMSICLQMAGLGRARFPCCRSPDTLQSSLPAQSGHSSLAQRTCAIPPYMTKGDVCRWSRDNRRNCQSPDRLLYVFGYEETQKSVHRCL